MKKFRVPVNEPYLFGNEKKYLIKCIKDGFVSSAGPFVEKFEKKFAKRLKRKFAISVSNGTAALQLAFESLNIKRKGLFAIAKASETTSESDDPVSPLRTVLF